MPKIPLRKEQLTQQIPQCGKQLTWKITSVQHQRGCLISPCDRQGPQKCVLELAHRYGVSPKRAPITRRARLTRRPTETTDDRPWKVTQEGIQYLYACKEVMHICYVRTYHHVTPMYGPVTGSLSEKETFSTFQRKCTEHNTMKTDGR